MPDTLTCVRCGRTTPPLDKPPLPGKVGEEIAANVCPACWEEWQRAEVMVINELRLNFMDPKSLDVLTQHMREFLMLEGGDSPAS